MDVEVMIFYCNMKAKELVPKYCGTQEIMNVAKNTELGKKFVNEFLECCEGLYEAYLDRQGFPWDF